MALILVVDDDAAFRDALVATLESLGHRVLAAASGREGLVLLRRHAPDLALVDFRMPDMDGLAMLRAVHAQADAPATPIVMLTAYATSHNTIEAMKLGAFDHLTKPVGRRDLADLVERIEGMRAPQAASSPDAVEDDLLIGQSPAMREVHKRIGLAATSSFPVLIRGETGTGKELIAHALAQASERAHQPFVAVNCAAIPSELIESELFGHGKGAFSGAVQERKGHVREADRGVLFLDEIGDMPLSMQAKLLRVLQEGQVVPLGASQPVAVDVRVVAATHRDLAAMVDAGEFRRDLLYRLNVVQIELPPLRSRVEDIRPLAEHFLRLNSDRPKQLSADAMLGLMEHAWPGNVRELRNVMERCKVLARGEVIQRADIDACMDASITASTPDGDWLEGDLPTALARLEKAMIERALARAHGNRAEAARQLGIHRPLLYRKLRDYGLD